MFQFVKSNIRDIAVIVLSMLLLTAGLFYGQKVFPPLAYMLNFLWYGVIAAIVFLSPWAFLTITLPNTVGKFLNGPWFEVAWNAVGKPDDMRVDLKGHKVDVITGLEPFRFAGALKRQLYLTLALYCVLVLAGALVAFAAFMNGITILG